MALVMKLVDGQHCPVVFCEYCKEIIDRGADGLHLWRSDSQQARETILFFVHRGDCDRGFCDDNGGRAAWLSGNLELLPIMLESNLRVDHDEAVRMMDFRL